VSRYLHSAPGTVTYLAILAVTTLTLHTSSGRVGTVLLRQQSTNLANMVHHPVSVLISSAFWIQSGNLLTWLAPFALVLAPAERWLGTWRWLAVFVAGHVGATLITLAGIWSVTHGGVTQLTLVHDIDVGISYGFYAVAAVLLYRLPVRWRLVLATALLARLSYAAVGGGYTELGHVCAALIGLACWPIVHRRLVRVRAQAEASPWYALTGSRTRPALDQRSWWSKRLPGLGWMNRPSASHSNSPAWNDLPQAKILRPSTFSTPAS